MEESRAAGKKCAQLKKKVQALQQELNQNQVRLQSCQKEHETVLNLGPRAVQKGDAS